MLSILLLSIATLINGGITSKYVRQAQPANEMSLETFPSPAGHNAPEQVLVSSSFYQLYLNTPKPRTCIDIFCLLWLQVHLTQGDHNGRGMIISWVTPLNLDGSNVVTYWIASNGSDIKRRKKKASTSSYKFYDYSSGFLHHATIKNLEVCVLFIT